MNVLLLANWGIGVEILKALDNNSHVHGITVVTQYNKNSTDKWENALFNYSQKILRHETICQKKLSFEDIKRIIKDKSIDLMVTHAYMRILPIDIFSMPGRGTVNIHPSLLPKYRGASPAKLVLKNREKETGLTCHYMDKGIDTGDIIHQVKVPVKESDTVETIIEREKKHVENLINASLLKIMDPFFIPKQQSGKPVSYAPKLDDNNAVRI